MRDRSGRPVPLASFRRATPVALGADRYLMQTGTDADGQPAYLLDDKGRPYVMDFEVLRPLLRQRRPDAFLGGTR